MRAVGSGAHARVRLRAVPKRSVWNLPEWYNKNAKTPEQIALKEELNRGYWWEGQELMKQPNGKIWHAPRSILPPNHGPAWPQELELHRLKSIAKSEMTPIPLQGAGGAQIVLASGHRFAAWPMLESWAAPISRDLPHLLPEGRLAELCLVADAPYAVFSFVWERLARSQAPAERHQHLGFVYGKHAHALRTYLGVHNRLLAYVFLLDSFARVRWRAVGHATAPELSSLYNALKQLEREAPSLSPLAPRSSPLFPSSVPEKA